MDYEPLRAAAERWGISPEAAKKLAQRGNIPGVEKVANRWLVPKDAWPLADRFGRPPGWIKNFRESPQAQWQECGGTTPKTG